MSNEAAQTNEKVNRNIYHVLDCKGVKKYKLHIKTINGEDKVKTTYKWIEILESNDLFIKAIHNMTQNRATLDSGMYITKLRHHVCFSWDFHTGSCYAEVVDTQVGHDHDQPRNDKSL